MRHYRKSEAKPGGLNNHNQRCQNGGTDWRAKGKWGKTLLSKQHWNASQVLGKIEGHFLSPKGAMDIDSCFFGGEKTGGPPPGGKKISPPRGGGPPLLGKKIDQDFRYRSSRPLRSLKSQKRRAPWDWKCPMINNELEWDGLCCIFKSRKTTICFWHEGIFLQANPRFI